MYFKKKKYSISNAKILQPKQIHFCERGKPLQNLVILYQPFIFKNRQNLILLLSKIDDLPKNTALWIPRLCFFNEKIIIIIYVEYLLSQYITKSPSD